MSFDPIQNTGRLIEATQYSQAPAFDVPTLSTPPRVDEDNTTFYCERCQRPSGPEMLGCERRPVNQCPYVLQKEHQPYWVVMIALLFFGAFLAVPLMGILKTSDPSVFIICFTLPFLAVGLVGLAFVFHSLLSEETGVSNPATGFAWYTVTLFGRPIEQTVTLGIQPIPLDFSAVSVLKRDFPISVQALKAEKALFVPAHAARNTLEVALMSLMQQGVLIAGIPRLHRGKLGGRLREIKKPDYVILLNPTRAQEVDGALEQRIVNTMTCWFNEGKGSRRGGLSVLEICRALLEGEKYIHAHLWILEMVHQDAVARGAGTLLEDMPTGALKRVQGPYRPTPAMEERAAEVDVIRKAFIEAHPAFGRYLHQNVEKGLNLMDPSY